MITLSALLLIPLAVASFAVAGDPGEDDYYKQFPVFQDVLRLVRQAYVDEVDLGQLMAGAFQGLGDALDPFSTLVPAEHVETLRANEGAPPASGLVLAHSNGVVFVVSVLPESPAAKAEIQPGDIVTEIGGTAVRNLPLWDVEMRLADLGEGLDVGILRGGEQTVSTLQPQEAAEPVVWAEANGEFLTLRVHQTTEATVAEVAGVLAEARERGLQGVLVDLRRAWGRDYQAATDLAAVLGGERASDFVGREGTRERVEASTEVVWDGPVVTLVSRGTHGAGELAARLLAERHATVGQSTFGYLGSQAWIPVGEGAFMRTASGFFAPVEEGDWSIPLEPEIVVTGRDRRYSQQETTLDELTEERGLAELSSLTLGRAA